MAVVAVLRTAPVKGLATVRRDHVHLDVTGVAEDRRVLLLDQRGAVVTMRSHPELVRVVPGLDLDRGELRVAFPGGEQACSGLDDVAEPAGAHLFGKDRAGRVLPGDVADALSDAAGERLRVLVATPGEGWDEGPVSMLGRSSAVAVGGPDRDLDRYRMLVELEGTQPFEEDTWVGRDVRTGEAVVRVTHALQRCVVVNHSPAGTRDWDGLHALAAARGRDRLCLGVIAEVVTPGEVAVGDDVAPLSAP